MEHILTPKTEEHLFRNQILPPISRGECLTIIWVPHSGMRKQMVYLTENAGKFGFKQLGKYFVTYINFDELTKNTPANYFSLLLLKLNQNQYFPTGPKDPFLAVKEKIEEYLRKDFHLIFILGKFDRINFPSNFYNNLICLWQLNKIKVHFIFAANQTIFENEKIEKYGQLSELILQNKIYSPILSQSDSIHAIDNLAKKYKVQVSQEQKNLAQKLGGGHPSLTKICLRMLSRNPQIRTEEQAMETVGNCWEIEKLLNDIWDSLAKEEQNFLIKMLSTNRDRLLPPENLLKLGIIFQKNEEINFFSPLFEFFVNKAKPLRATLSINKLTGDILVNGFPAKEKIAYHQFQLLSKFLENPRKLFSREEIAGILWGKDSYEKYSDWAIDQNISLLRKKLKKIGISPNCLQTLKGLGYRWEV